MPDLEPKRLTPEDAHEMVVKAQEDKIGEISQFWHSEVEKAITRAAGQSERSTCIINLGHSKANELVAYGKALGWQVTMGSSGGGAIHIKWLEPKRSKPSDAKPWWRFW